MTLFAAESAADCPPDLLPPERIPEDQPDLHPHGRSCLCTTCLPDTFAMGTADYASAKRVMWA